MRFLIFLSRNHEKSSKVPQKFRQISSGDEALHSAANSGKIFLFAGNQSAGTEKTGERGAALRFLRVSYTMVSLTSGDSQFLQNNTIVNIFCSDKPVFAPEKRVKEQD
jgi:hypothetical protein